MTELLIKIFIRNREDEKSPQVRGRYGFLAGIVGIICNAILSCGKILIGSIFGSLAVLADGINNLSDAASSVVTLIGFKLAARPADEKHPFGHARIEYIAGMIISFFIILLGFDLTKTAVGKIIHPEEINFSLLTIGILMFSILLKLWMAGFNHKLSKKINSTTLAAAKQDSLNDVVTTSAVLIAILIAKFTGLKLDGYIGLAVALFIIYSGIRLIIETMSPLLGEAPDHELVNEICEKIKSYDKVLGIHDLVVHNYGPGRCFASVHAEMDYKNDIMESHDITDRIERDFAAEGIQLVVHLDPIVTDDEELEEARRLATGVIQRLDERFSLHDFRMVKGAYHINLIFDVVVPSDCKKTNDQICGQIDAEMKKMNDNYFTVIEIDRCYVGLH